MATPEDEIKDLREKNNELVQKVQYWKMTAAQRENEKLELMKEINELRLKLSRLRSGGAAQARKLDAELQSASEEALNHLVLASGAVARTIELAKSYMRDRQQLDAASPRWSSIGGTPNTDRVHRVPPMMGGQSILQPVVSLSRTILNTSNPRSASRSPNQSQRNITERAVPMHMLQDVYIPLTRIDAGDLPGQNVESDPEVNNMDTSAEDLGLEDSNERSPEESQNITEEEFEESRRLDAVTEDLEEEDEIETPPRRSRSENPLEGPSWLLDRPGSSKSEVTRHRMMNSEPDSTTEVEEGTHQQPRASRRSNNTEKESGSGEGGSPSEAGAGGAEPAAMAFTPTVRRRKRTSSPPDASYSPRPRRASTSGRVLKVLIAKMRLDAGAGDADADGAPAQGQVQAASPPKPPVRFDAPSPNGSTDARVIVSEVIRPEPMSCGAGDAASRDCSVRDSAAARDSRRSSGSDSRASDEGRTRRTRKAITYKEKPLNRKMRR